MINATALARFIENAFLTAAPLPQVMRRVAQDGLTGL